MISHPISSRVFIPCVPKVFIGAPNIVQDIAGFSGTLPDESVVDVFGKAGILARHAGEEVGY